MACTARVEPAKDCGDRFCEARLLVCVCSGKTSALGDSLPMDVFVAVVLPMMLPYVCFHSCLLFRRFPMA